MGYNVHDVLIKIVAYYKEKHKNLKNDFFFGYDLKLLSFLNTKH
jgi:hypothetical protein